MFEDYSFQRLVTASNEELRRILAELRNEISAFVIRALESQDNESKKIDAFHQAVEEVCQSLGKHGHILGALDTDQDVRLDHNSEIWASHYRDCGPNGLEIQFTAKKVLVLWVVSPRDENRPGF